MFIGLDIGGTFLKGARIDDQGTVHGRLHQAVRQDSAEAFLGQIVSAVRELEGAGGCRGVGVGLPGIIDRSIGGVHVAPNLKILEKLPVAGETARATRRPTFVENDANAAALAESWIGAGQGAQGLLYVTLGTGVGAAVILDGRVWLGRSGYAGELGHVQVDPQGAPCGCGSWGCLEGVAGAPGWQRLAEAAIRTRDSSLRGSV